MTDYLCPEGKRLWDKWYKSSRDIDLTGAFGNSPNEADVKAANENWTDYQDHRAACKECTPLTIRKGYTKP